ncbi:S66 peptidase family protein [Gulosibacter bifidus]|uniref:LD-carboxypeptidase n=1 Tax=Gulosibacter bifidus TaxID=272239 RepID=A0ABW5RJH1_9MICO|nr:LD-carboxypeptidase [Gulosibacter bifidus]
MISRTTDPVSADLPYPELAPLKPGDRVGIITPSSRPGIENYERSIDIIREWCLEPVFGKHVRAANAQLPYLAGTDEQRASDLMDAWCDDSLAAVFCLRGGYGSMRIVDLLDIDRLRRAKPKALVGSSDITGLHEFWEQHLGVATWFAPMFATNDLLHSRYNLDHLKRALFSPVSKRSLRGAHAETMVPGTAEGTLTGGNLTLIRMARGMNLYADGAGAAGKIVLIEDVDEETWRLDGSLTTLLRSGYFDGVAGIALGTWSKCGIEREVKAVLYDRLAPLGVPLIWGVPFGHAQPVDTVPLGVRARIVADAHDPRIEIL